MDFFAYRQVGKTEPFDKSAKALRFEKPTKSFFLPKGSDCRAR